jgi:hypothetical protein
MKTLRFLGVLFWCLALSGPSPAAEPGFAPDAPASPIQHLRAAQVNAEAMQRLALDTSWRYQPGQPPGWANPATDDHAWLLASASFPFGRGPAGWRGTGCFRLHFTADSALVGQPLGLRILQEGAMEVYLDGQLLGRYGTVGTSAQTTRSYRPIHRMLPFMLQDAGPHLLAVRYARFTPWPPPHGGFAVWVGAAHQLMEAGTTYLHISSLHLISTTAFAMLALLHFFLFVFYRPQRANLYYSLTMGTAAFSGPPSSPQRRRRREHLLVDLPFLLAGYIPDPPHHAGLRLLRVPDQPTLEMAAGFGLEWPGGCVSLGS